ncbi:Uncharacterised protein [Bordetella ansorpii]|uniref:Uncharacterized protein n=1 Tax=Bordetella ansorpii TaxID=288768 RepID=A0A157SVU9_9BORD|nr:hypothetical protein [Bordetella ansorpii]SAI74588.1 Uncharacterised protein [Bordetella ansorpii]
MARKKTITAPAEPLPAVNQDAYNADLATLRAAQEGKTQDEMDEVLAAGVDLGRLETALFYATVADSVLVQTYEKIKKSKGWVHFKKRDGRAFESLEDFCQEKFGKSQRRLQELISNRNILGQEAFEQAERIGLHQRDYNAIKALPPPEQEIVRRAVEEAQTREEVLDLMQELAVRHGQERAEQQKAIDDAKAEQRAMEKLHAEAAERSRTLQTQLEKLQLRTASWDDKVAPFKVEITERQTLIDEALMRHQQATEALDAWLTQELATEPGYDPEALVDLPPPVLSVVLHLADSIERTASMVAAARADLLARFGAEIELARSHVLTDPAAE